MLQIPQRKL